MNSLTPSRDTIEENNKIWDKKLIAACKQGNTHAVELIIQRGNINDKPLYVLSTYNINGIIIHPKGYY